MEDQESEDESHAVGRQVQALSEQDLLPPMQAQGARLVVGVLARRGEDDPDAQGDRHERQGLLEQMGPALALPGPPADHVAHDRAGQPSGCPGNARRDVRYLQDEIRQLGRTKGKYRRWRKADQPPATLAAESFPQRAGHHSPTGGGDLRRYKAHGFPSLTKASWSVTKVYSTGPCGGPNREVLQVSDTPRARGDPEMALRRRTATEVDRLPSRPRSGIKQRQPTDR